MNQSALVPGSIAALAQQQGASLAETFINADVIVICDTSGSMGSCDSRGGRSRYDVELEELAGLQRRLPGKIAVLSFSSQVMFCPGGQPYNFGGGTNLAGALDFARVADVPGMKFIVISDGQPDEPGAALTAARKYKAKIDTVYCGPEDDWGGGRSFLAQLAQASGGQAVTADRVLELGAKVEQLLLSGR